MTCRPFRALRDDEHGFSLVEVMVGMGIFAVIAMGFAGTMAASLKAQLVSRERTVASELATQHVEQARALPYADLGTSGGNPPGTLPNTEDVPVDGDTYVVRTSVELVDDQVPGTYRTYANYKRLTVTVHDDETGRRLARARTIVAPPTQPNLLDAVIQVKVGLMAGDDGVPGATVSLTEGPSSGRSATTDAAGEVTFAGLTPTGAGSVYRVEPALPAGWHVLPEDLTDANMEKEALATQQIPFRFRSYQEGSIEITLEAGGLPFLGPATVTVASDDWGSEDFAVVDGHLVVTQVAGRPVMSGVDYEIDVVAGALTGSAEARPVADGADVVVPVPLGIVP